MVVYCVQCDGELGDENKHKCIDCKKHIHAYCGIAAFNEEGLPEEGSDAGRRCGCCVVVDSDNGSDTPMVVSSSNNNVNSRDDSDDEEKEDTEEEKIKKAKAEKTKARKKQAQKVANKKSTLNILNKQFGNNSSNSSGSSQQNSNNKSNKNNSSNEKNSSKASKHKSDNNINNDGNANDDDNIDDNENIGDNDNNENIDNGENSGEQNVKSAKSKVDNGEKTRLTIFLIGLAGNEVSTTMSRSKTEDLEKAVMEKFRDWLLCYEEDFPHMSNRSSNLTDEVILNGLTGRSIWRKFGELKGEINNHYNSNYIPPSSGKARDDSLETLRKILWDRNEFELAPKRKDKTPKSYAHDLNKDWKPPEWDAFLHLGLAAGAEICLPSFKTPVSIYAVLVYL